MFTQITNENCKIFLTSSDWKLAGFIVRSPTHLEILSTLPKRLLHIYIEITQSILHCHRFFDDHETSTAFFVIDTIIQRYGSHLFSNQEKKKKKKRKKRNLVAFVLARSFEVNWFARVSKSFAFSASLPRNLAETLRFGTNARNKK